MPKASVIGQNLNGQKDSFSWGQNTETNDKIDKGKATGNYAGISQIARPAQNTWLV